ncbi:MAG: hypothetical protein WB816_14060 [Methylocystis sp.]
MLADMPLRSRLPLSPGAALDELGLAGAFDALARCWRESYPEIAVTLEVADLPLGEESALAAYRIAREGLTNALRHSGAGHGTSSVALKTPDQPRVRVAYDGAGLKPGGARGSACAA